VKCPKCDYLGFETGDRCKNCGYDFSLLSAADSEPADYEIHPPAVDDVPAYAIDDISRHQDIGDAIASLSLTPETPFEDDARTALPLFTLDEEDNDEPLIKFAAAPRPPLAVRRTPDTPRLRAVPRTPLRPSPAPALQFSEEEEVLERSAPPEQKETVVEPSPAGIITEQPSRPGPRVVAALIDHLILFGIDAAVVYFTVRMAGLAMSEWRVLPVAPMFTFLALLKMSYFYAFTAVGGQTIGKMAVGTCVVADDGRPVGASRAMRRTSAGVVSCLLLGLGFIPALFGDHRALHDRLAGTRVVRVRSV
jgi:uncharacterized RDD family membrane protein YckC